MSYSKIISGFFAVMAILAFTLTPQAEAAVVTYIDLFETNQGVQANNTTTSNTTASSTSIGGFRTLRLTATGGSPNPFFQSSLAVDNFQDQLLLSTYTGSAPSYEVKWGGAGGTSGLGGIDFTGGVGYFSLGNAFLDFTLNFSDSAANTFTWSFTDTAANVASYTSSFPILPAGNPAIPFSISLASFSGAGAVNWQSINFIALSGAGAAGYDFALSPPVGVTVVPEPGTWAAAGLLLCGAIYLRWRRSRANVGPQEAAAAA